VGPGDGNDTPLGNILIVAENVDDDNLDGLVDDPDDHANGGDILFNFSTPTTVKSVTFVDVETRGVKVAGFAQDTTPTFSAEATPLTNNSVQTMDFSSLSQAPSARLLITPRELAATGELTIGRVTITLPARARRLRIS